MACAPEHHDDIAAERATSSPLISMSNPAEDLDPSLLDARGGFAWWYLDHVDDRGDGLVLVWSFGLPFLPDYTGAAREGRGQPARQRPSLNLVLYEAGRPSFYLLQEYAPDACEWAPDRWRFGDTRLRLERDPRRTRLVADLDCPLPRSADRLTGRVLVEGPAVTPKGAPPPRDRAHEWSPVLGPAHLQADLRLGRQPVMRRGAAYHDRNGGTHPLDQLGIDRWTWGRWIDEAGTHIFYVLWPEDAPDAPWAWRVDITPDGAATVRRDLTVTTSSWSRARYGMPYARQLELQTAEGEAWSVHTRHVVDDGPFYLRTMVTRAGAPRLGVGEWVIPRRLDLGWQRPFIRMRVHNTAAPNSMWLPLFSGPRRGRLRRLIGGEA